MTPDPVGLVYLAASVATLVAALLPRLLGRVPISMPMVFVAAGMGRSRCSPICRIPTRCGTPSSRCTSPSCA